MKLAQDQDFHVLEVLVAMIAHSQIVVVGRNGSKPRLPAGFAGVDVAILEWIAAEARRVGRNLVRM